MDQLVSIIIPAYNEEKTIGKIIKKIRKSKIPFPYEIIVVDDGSRDNTKKIAESLGVKVVSNYKNMGKGYSMRKGVKYCNGDIIVFQDADLEYDPRDISKLLKPLLIRKNIAVYGSRFKKKTNKITSFYRFGNLLISFLINLFFHSHLSDVETGYKAMRKDIFKKLELKANGFEIEVEITIHLLKKGYKILEIPISYKARSRKRGKKINIFDGVKSILYIIRELFLCQTS